MIDQVRGREMRHLAKRCDQTAGEESFLEARTTGYGDTQETCLGQPIEQREIPLVLHGDYGCFECRGGTDGLDATQNCSSRG